MAEEINIKVKALGGGQKEFTVKVPKNIAIPDLKARLSEISGVPVAQQRLIYLGKVLKDEHTLADYQLKEEGTLHMVAKPPEVASAPNPTPVNPAAQVPPVQSPPVQGTSILMGVVPGGRSQANLDQILTGVLGSIGIGPGAQRPPAVPNASGGTPQPFRQLTQILNTVENNVQIAHGRQANPPAQPGVSPVQPGVPPVQPSVPSAQPGAPSAEGAPQQSNFQALGQLILRTEQATRDLLPLLQQAGNNLINESSLNADRQAAQQSISRLAPALQQLGLLLTLMSSSVNSVRFGEAPGQGSVGDTSGDSHRSFVGPYGNVTIHVASEPAGMAANARPNIIPNPNANANPNANPNVPAQPQDPQNPPANPPNPQNPANPPGRGTIRVGVLQPGAPGSFNLGGLLQSLVAGNPPIPSNVAQPQPGNPNAVPNPNPNSNPSANPNAAQASQNLFANLFQNLNAAIPEPAAAANSSAPMTGMLSQMLSQMILPMMQSLGVDLNDQPIGRWLVGENDQSFEGQLLAAAMENITIQDFLNMQSGNYSGLEKVGPSLKNFLIQALNGRSPLDFTNFVIQRVSTTLDENNLPAAIKDRIKPGCHLTNTALGIFHAQILKFVESILAYEPSPDPNQLVFVDLWQRWVKDTVGNIVQQLSGSLIGGEADALSVIEFFLNQRLSLINPQMGPIFAAYLMSLIRINYQRQQQEAANNPVQPPPAVPQPPSEPMVVDSEPKEIVFGDYEEILKRDIERQANLPPSRPFSDAYLQGVPVIKRPVNIRPSEIRDSQYLLTNRVSSALANCTVLSESDNIPVELFEDQRLAELYVEQLKKDVRNRLENDPDYDPKRFPNAAKFFFT